MRRALDVALAAAALVLLSPLMALVALAVRVFMGPPVLFGQPRAGLHGTPFVLWKFRTMRDEVDAAGQPLPDAQRLTPLGRLLRRYSIDELPELVNVVKGDMSLVGPRPLPLRYLDRYSADQARRHTVKPGVTGLAQVRGRNALSWEEKLALDVWYVDNQSLWLDAKVLLATPLVVLTGWGVSHAGHATMEEFQG